ncbi:MAG: DEAD/DEAH box helicase, partial [Caulobacterales bacterium]|nr:DEAD/DEAH box helicase [Caulobacterales bacterium]
LLDWIKEDTDSKCRILTNAKCLSEGVDVPALDAIMFMHPRKSKIDIVQSVGRVMRRAPNKKMGYVILPIVIKSDMTPEQALDNDESYKVVWDILNALRSHDERLDAKLNQIDLGADVSDQIEIVAISNNLPNKAEPKQKEVGIGQGAAANTDDDEPKEPSIPKEKPKQFELVFDEFSTAIMAKIVKKCGRRDYWENWASDIADIAKAHITRITGIIAKPDTDARKAFDGFLEEIRDDLNESITEADAVEMLAQHIITKPVFDALFEGYSFTENNPVSKAMQSILGILYEHNVEKEAESLEKFYESVKRRAAGIDKAEAKQKIIVELYDKFFRTAFPRMTEKLGIVYTPVEVVDFIIHSVNDVLKSEFGQTLGSEGVHILDPFTGTGTFITRLLQSGLIAPDELERKYKEEIHANEIVLLAYYIAAINIEAVYHTQSGGEYAPFEGICLTDTFQLYEKDDLVSGMMADNSNRRTRQKKLDIRVIMGNPPYSAGQKSDNDEAENVKYETLDSKIQSTYARHSTGNPRSLYDNYIRAFRWGSDRIGNAGIMAYVSNAGWIDSKAADGLRKCLAEDFTSLYIFHLRGNQRTQGEQSRKEGGKIFGSGSRAPISINIFIKNTNSTERGKIYFHDIGDYLSQQDKLSIISNFKSIEGISQKNSWQIISPDEHNDWLGQRDNSFDDFIAMGDKKDKKSKVLFDNYSSGLKTNRDAWAYNSSKISVAENMERMIEFYHLALNNKKIDGINDPSKISWSWVLRERFEKGKTTEYTPNKIFKSIYRPYIKQWLYYDGFFNENRYLIPKLFPVGNEANLVIDVSGAGSKNFSVLMANIIPCLDMVEKGQCFPLYYYDAPEVGNLFAGDSLGFNRREAITNDGLKHFHNAYPSETINKEDIFYYVYGLLHSQEYREKYADNLSKQLPRIPCVKSKDDFWAFVSAGRELGNLHVNYETVEPYAVEIESDPSVVSKISDEQFYRVTKMKHGGKRPNIDKTTVIYNDYITLRNIPIEAYEYVVNGKPAIEWVMERQGVSIDKHNPEKNTGSGIVNDANLYAIETMQNPAYPVELLQRVITVSMETIRIVNSLPKLEI